MNPTEDSKICREPGMTNPTMVDRHLLDRRLSRDHFSLSVVVDSDKSDLDSDDDKEDVDITTDSDTSDLDSDDDQEDVDIPLIVTQMIFRRRSRRCRYSRTTDSDTSDLDSDDDQEDVDLPLIVTQVISTQTTIKKMSIFPDSGKKVHGFLSPVNVLL
ncbi:unnamed protein product [Mytilus edulis]|uniref:Uncharacterized protein n=1 Tax=Mytilus edulis TaxID=6550 RepID=A0A8S3RKN2_MYTED|nr:unnamed protein product [Mytilus edulis]